MIGYDFIMKYTVTDNVHDTFLIAEDIHVYDQGPFLCGEYYVECGDTLVMLMIQKMYKWTIDSRKGMRWDKF